MQKVSALQLSIVICQNFKQMEMFFRRLCFIVNKTYEPK